MKHQLPWWTALRSKGAAQIASSTSWLIAEKFVKIVLLVLVGSWMARSLGPEAFGELSYVVALVALLQGVASLSADGLVVRDLVRNPDQASRILGTALLLRVVAGIACWGMTVLCVWAWSPDDHLPVLLVTIVGATLVFQSVDTIDLWFQSRGRIMVTAQARMLAYLIANGLKVALILGNASLVAFGVVASIEAMLIASALALAYRRHPAAQPWHRDFMFARAMLKECWPLMVASLAGAAYLRADQVLVKQLLGSSNLGIYMAALQISQVTSVLPLVLTTALGPFVARWQAQESTLYERKLVAIFRLFFYAGLGLSCLIAVLASPLITLLFGPAFASAASVLAVHAFCGPFVFLGTAHNLWLWNSGELHVRLVGTLIAGAFSVACNLWLLPLHGLIAAAWIAVASQLIAALAINAWLAPRSFVLQLAAIFFLPPRMLYRPR